MERETNNGLIRRFQRLLIHALRARRTVCLTLITLLLFALFSLFFFASFSTDITEMIPEDSESAKVCDALVRVPAFNRATLLLSTKDGRPIRELPGLDNALDAVAQSLVRALENNPAGPLIPSYRYAPRDPMQSLLQATRHLPQYRPPETLPSPANLVESVYKQLLLPSGFGRTEQLRADPVGFTTALLRNMNTLSEIASLKIDPATPFLFSDDGTVLSMELAVPRASPADARVSKHLMSALDNWLEYDLPSVAPELSGELLLPHRRAVYNENAIRRDIGIVSISSLILFTLLTILMYRGDLRSLFIPLIPLTASLVILGFMPLFFPKVLLFVVGMGGIVISLAVDYGIHTYAAMNESSGVHRLVRILPPLLLGAVTSMVVFLLFVLSPAQGIRQLGFFAAFSLLLSMGMMVLILPRLLRRSGTSFPRSVPVTNTDRPSDSPEEILIIGGWDGPSAVFPPWKTPSPGIVLTLWAILLVGALSLLPFFRFHADVRQFDLSPPSMEEQEDRFERLFLSGEQPAAALFLGPESESDITLARSELPSDLPFPAVSPADFFPPKPQREKNRSAWTAYFAEGAWRKYRAEVTSEGLKRDFDETFFEPFFRAVEDGVQDATSHTPPELVHAVFERLSCSSGSGDWAAIVRFPDEPDAVRRMSERPGAVVLSRKNFARQLSDDISRGTSWLAVAAILAVAGLTFAYFRTVRLSLLALTPVVSSLCITPAILFLAGKPLNLPVLIAGIVLCGLSIDYGFFTADALRTGTFRQIRSAIALSAATTFAGGMTVLFTRHPMLRDAGITIMIGIVVAYLTARFVLPVLLGVLSSAKPVPLRRAAGILAAAAPLFFGTACASHPFRHEPFPPLPETRYEKTTLPTPKPGLPKEVFQQFSIVLDAPFLKIASLCLVSRTEDEQVLAGLNPGGIKLFELAGCNDELVSYLFAEDPPHAEQTARAIWEDFRFLYSVPYFWTSDLSGETSIRGRGRILRVYETARGEKKTPLLLDFAGKELRLIRAETPGLRIVEIFSYERTETDHLLPTRIVLDNHRYRYRLILRAAAPQPQEDDTP